MNDNESILTSIKKMLGIASDDESFDTDIIILINSALATLNQIGVGKFNYLVSDSYDTWDDFLQGMPGIESAKNYVFMRVKLGFDSLSMSSAVIETYKTLIREEEWRLSVASETNFSK